MAPTEVVSLVRWMDGWGSKSWGKAAPTTGKWEMTSMAFTDLVGLVV